MRGRKPLPKVRPPGERVEVGVPNRPTQLMGKPAAIREWKRIVPELQRRGLWEDTDEALIVLWCESAHDMSEANDELKKHGRLIEDSKGGLKSNPAARMKKAAADTMVRILAELGLTPSALSRRRETAGGFGGDDPLAELLRRRQG